MRKPVRDIPLPGDAPLLLHMAIRIAIKRDDHLNEDEHYVFWHMRWMNDRGFVPHNCPCAFCTDRRGE